MQFYPRFENLIPNISFFSILSGYDANFQQSYFIQGIKEPAEVTLLQN